MNPIEEHINYYQNFAPNPTAFRESLEGALVYAKNANKNLNTDLRDYFAAKALNGVIQTFYDALTKDGQSCDFSYQDKIPNSLSFCVAESVYAIADAMMESRKL